MATQVPVTLDTPIVVKIQFRGQNKKFKLPLKDLGAHVLPEKLRAILQVTADQEVIFERYSDSAGAYVTLDSNKPQVYKTLFRAAKAKLKLRLRATIPGEIVEPTPAPAPAAPAPPPPAKEPINPDGVSLHRLSSETLTPHGIAPISPVIAHSPGPCPPAPKFEAVSPVSPPVPPKVEPEVDEAPVPRSFTARRSFFNDLANASYPDLVIRPKPAEVCTSWVVYCNNCNQPMEDAHFHCGICDSGDYDLCPSCVDSGIHCPGTGHWMVKRFVKNGCIVNSTTERVGPKIKNEEQEIPGAFTDEKQSITYENEEPTRTCNCCVKVLPEKEFVTCGSCDDYDLCLECHVSNKHGHHPGHAFKAATGETVLQGLADYLCNAGRNVRHSAVCDGCDKFIYGVRHKCLNCPDWDYCSECIRNAKFIHPRHRFVPIYEPLAEPFTTGNRHYGIYCDGPLCKDKENLSYIEGIRYKCAVCHDTDFCQNCESHPTNKHNHTHPLIKFKTPVRSVSVTTLNEDKTGKSITRVGDRELPSRRSTATETSPVAPSTNAATQVQTILDMKPSEASQPKVTKEKIEIRDLLAEPVKPVQEKISVLDLLSSPVDEVKPVKTAPVSVPKPAPAKNLDELDAHFIRDTIADGSKICAGFQFVQVWTLRNPGPNAWPAGCSVRHVGGDNMLNIDNTQPLSQSELDDASESNVMGRTVEPGEEISFRVVMKAPKREGTAISYWRLKTGEGIPFGHRLWCDIQVIAPPCAAPPTSTEASEASSSSTTPTMTPYERLQQAKLERIRLAQSHAQQYSQQQPEVVRDEQVNWNEMLNNEERAKVQRAHQLRKAAVDRILNARHKEHEAALATIRQEPVPELEKVPEVPVKQATAELPVEPQVLSSGMIFPQLEKESPTSSTHDFTAPPESPMSERSTIAGTVTVRSSSDDEFFEDAESVDIRSVSDDGFMTDEEYDILDASDEEMP